MLENKKSKRVILFEEMAEQLGKKVTTFTVKPSTTFPEKNYFQSFNWYFTNEQFHSSNEITFYLKKSLLNAGIFH